MQGLSLILIKLSQKILNVSQNNKLKLLKLLLKYLDPQFFTSGLLMSISTFSELSTETSVYYKQKFNQKIRESFFYQAQLEDRFVCVFKLIVDLALNGERKGLFLSAILQMNQEQKNLLMQFVAGVVKREQFIDFNCTSDQQITNNFTSQLSSHNLVMQQQFIELKQQFTQLQRKYVQMTQSYFLLNASYYKVMKQLTHLKHEKLQLLEDLGLHHNCGYADISEKYRKQVSDFAKDTQKMHRELDQKTAELKAKDNQQQELIINYTSKRQLLSLKYQQKISQQIKKSSQRQKELQQLKQKQNQYLFQVLRLKDVIMDLRKDIQDKNKKLYEHQATVEKFNKMKKVHLQFRKQMIENFRNGVGVTRASGLGL